MSDEPYSNRELDGKFQAILDKCDSIIKQTTKHNGRLSRAEQWMWVMTGGLAVIVAVVIPMLTFYVASVDARITKIENVFSTYNIEIIE